MRRVLGADLVMLGLSHRTAAVDVRQRHARPVESLQSCLESIARLDGVSGCCVLSTCNRTELLATVDDGPQRIEAVSRCCFPARDVDPEAFREHWGIDAVFHLFCIAAGLDSQVLGESEILAQLRRSYEVARQGGVLGPPLDALLQQAFAVGKRVRRDTALGAGTLSVAAAAVDLGARVFGTFQRVTAVVVGTGETGCLVARNLRAKGVSRLLLTNRTRERAEELAAEVGGEVHPLEALGDALAVANFVAVSVEAPEPVIRWDHVRRIRGRDRPVVLVDLSVPSAIESRVRDHQDVLVHDLDDLDAIVGHHRAQRAAEVAAAERIVVEETQKFLALRHYAVLKPLIQDLSRRFDVIQQETLTELGRDSSDPLARRLTPRLLAAALDALKQGARGQQVEDEIRTRFQTYVGRLGGRSST